LDEGFQDGYDYTGDITIAKVDFVEVEDWMREEDSKWGFNIGNQSHILMAILERSCSWLPLHRIVWWSDVPIIVPVDKE
jgi:hypothetical protein